MHHVMNEMREGMWSSFDIFVGCGHCKKAKPLFTNAAAAFKDNVKVKFSWILINLE